MQKMQSNLPKYAGSARFICTNEIIFRIRGLTWYPCFVGEKCVSTCPSETSCKLRLAYIPRSAWDKARRLMSVARISICHASANFNESHSVIAIEQGSSPVEHPALHMRSARGS